MTELVSVRTFPTAAEAKAAAARLGAAAIASFLRSSAMHVDHRTEPVPPTFSVMVAPGDYDRALELLRGM